MNKLLTLGFGALVAASLVLPAVAAQPPSEPIRMELSRKPVMFDHSVHISADCSTCHTTMPQHFPMLTVDMEMGCITCHHVEPVDSREMACSDCHYDVDPRARENSSFRMAHARDAMEGTTSCLSCHLDVAKTRPEKRQALTACEGSSCHPR